MSDPALHNLHAMILNPGQKFEVDLSEVVMDEKRCIECRVTQGSSQTVLFFGSERMYQWFVNNLQDHLASISSPESPPPSERN